MSQPHGKDAWKISESRNREKTQLFVIPAHLVFGKGKVFQPRITESLRPGKLSQDTIINPALIGDLKWVSGMQQMLAEPLNPAEWGSSFPVTVQRWRCSLLHWSMVPHFQVDNCWNCALGKEQIARFS